jgi:hypothetical protein
MRIRYHDEDNGRGTFATGRATILLRARSNGQDSGYRRSDGIFEVGQKRPPPSGW